MQDFSYLPKLHACQTLVLREIQRLCQQHGIRYFMIAGTLLGAVRHGGFIPWDDDVDIGMLRQDYERFLEIAGQQLSDAFFLQTTQTDPHYGLPFAKILLKDTVLEERSASGKAKKGIFVDVFPFDAVPDDARLARRHDRKTYFYKRLLLAKRGYRPCTQGEYLKRAVYGMLRVLSVFYGGTALCRKLDKEITRYNGRQTERIVNIGGAYGYAKESIKRQWICDTVSLPFEHITADAPVGYKEYLQYFYGDYMTPPPENKRYNRHGVAYIDFGPYEEDVL